MTAVWIAAVVIAAVAGGFAVFKLLTHNWSQTGQ